MLKHRSRGKSGNDWVGTKRLAFSYVGAMPLRRAILACKRLNGMKKGGAFFVVGSMCVLLSIPWRGEIDLACPLLHNDFVSSAPFWLPPFAITPTTSGLNLLLPSFHPFIYPQAYYYYYCCRSPRSTHGALFQIDIHGAWLPARLVHHQKKLPYGAIRFITNPSLVDRETCHVSYPHWSRPMFNLMWRPALFQINVHGAWLPARLVAIVQCHLVHRKTITRWNINLPRVTSTLVNTHCSIQCGD